MSTATLTAPPRTTPKTYRFSVEEFDRMINAGVFTGETRIELIEGQVIPKSIPNPPHDNCVDLLSEQILALIPTGWRVRIQSGITLSGSVPSPDVCIAAGPRHTYATRRPEPTDIALLVEVADSTLDYDRTTKAEMYARDGIVEYWIVNIPTRQIEVYTQPSGPSASPTYAQTQVYAAGSWVPLTINGVAVGTIAVNDVIH
jgi:Uma2 family endonuclease